MAETIESIMPSIKLSTAEIVCGCLGRVAEMIPTMLPGESITFLSGHYVPDSEKVEDPQGTLDL